MGEIFRVTKTTNVTKMGGLLQNRFVDSLGNNRDRSVKLEFMGNFCAAQALLIIENAQRLAYRDLAFVVRYVEEQIDDDSATEGDALAASSKQVSVEITVTTA